MQARVKPHVVKIDIGASPDAGDPALPADTRTAVQQEYAALGWVVPQALAQCPEPAQVYYDQVAQIELPGWNRGRVTLLGDSCGAVSLLAGQGASLAVAGAYVLAQQLTTADSIESALTRYEKLWRPIVAEKQQVGRRSARWFLPSSPTQLWLRRTLLAASNATGLDRLITTAIAGKSGLPRDTAEILAANPRIRD